jgi:hypothetical protein
MEILLVVATLVIGVAVLFVTATFSTRTRQNTAPLIDAAAKDVSGRIDTATGDLKRQLQVLADEQQRDRDQTRFEGRKIQGRLDHADSRLSSVESRLLAELETIRRLSEQIGGRQDQMDGDLRRLDGQVAQLNEATVRFPASGQAEEEAAGEETAEAGSVGQFYAERLRFSTVRIPLTSFSQSERQFRIQVERDVGELPNPRLGNLGDPSAIAQHAKDDFGFRERLGKAAGGYIASRGGDPVFATTTERWVTQNAFPQTAVAEACNRIGKGLETIVERPLEKTAAEIRLPELEAASAAGIGSALILQPVTGPLGEPTTFLEITGLVIAMAAGLHPVALAGTKMLTHDQFHDLLAQGLMQAGRQLFEGPGGPGELPGPARPADEGPGISRPVITGPGPG